MSQKCRRKPNYQLGPTAPEQTLHSKPVEPAGILGFSGELVQGAGNITNMGAVDLVEVAEAINESLKTYGLRAALSPDGKQIHHKPHNAWKTVLFRSSKTIPARPWALTPACIAGKTLFGCRSIS